MGSVNEIDLSEGFECKLISRNGGDKNELQRLKQELDNYDYGINPRDYPENGNIIAECLDTLKAWEFLTVEQEQAIIKDILSLVEVEPKRKISHRKGDCCEKRK